MESRTGRRHVIACAIAAGLAFLFEFNTVAVATDIYSSPTAYTTTWTQSGSPYNIYCNITIPQGYVLNIYPGVTVNFMGHYYLDVQGTLTAIGVSGSEVVFTAANHTVGWAGMRFSSVSDPSQLTVCILEYAKKTGVSATDNGGAIYVKDFDDLAIDQCIFRYNSTAKNGGAIYVRGSYIQITFSHFLDNDAGSMGGGICFESCYGYNTVPAYLFGVTFRDNTAHYGGGVSCEEANVCMDLCYLRENSAIYDGGGFYCLGDCGALTILDGVFDGNEATNGAAIGCREASPWIEGNYIHDNVADDAGGGVFCRDGLNASDVTVYDNEFEDNLADNGGAIAGATTTMRIEENYIHDNVAWIDGGGIYVDDIFTYPTSAVPAVSSAIENNVIEENEALRKGGGVAASCNADISLTDNTLSGNVVTGGASGTTGGGGISCAGTYFRGANIVADGNAVTLNVSSDKGGGILLDEYSYGELTNNLIDENEAVSGAGLYCAEYHEYAVGADGLTLAGDAVTDNFAYSAGGGLYFESDCELYLFNCLVTGNLVDDGAGGGFYFESGGNPYIVTATICDNTAPEGAGLYCWNAPLIYNSILYRNGTDAGVSFHSSPYLENCDVQGGWQAFAGINGAVYNAASYYTPNHNITADPKFVGSGAHPYALNGVTPPLGFSTSMSPQSPCIDAGSLVALQAEGLDSLLPATDIAGQPRVSHSKIDIGAYEYQFPLASRTRW